MSYIYEKTETDGSKKGSWPEDIYRIQITDPILGGDDGVVNIQPKQLTNRTRWLLYTFLKEHGTDGKHQVTNDMVADDAAISESKLVLDKTIDSLKTGQEANEATLATLEALLATILGADGLLLYGITTTLSLLGKYSKYKYSFELFLDGITMREFANHDITCTAGQDDTLISRQDTSDLRANASLLVYDDEHCEEVIISSLHDYNHLRTKTDLERSYDEAVLGHTNWDVRSGFAYAGNGQIYLSKDMDNLLNYNEGNFIIRRGGESGGLAVYWRNASLHDSWKRVYPNSRYQISGDVYDEYYPINGWQSVQIKVVGTRVTPVKVEHMAFLPIYANRRFSTVRKPELLFPLANETVPRGAFYLQSSEYLNIYRDPYAKTEYRLIDPYTNEVKATYTATTTTTVVIAGKNLPVNGQYLVQARHVSDLGDTSEWSDAVFIELSAGRTWFGFQGAENAGSFDVDPMKGLQDQVVFFGFVGCQQSGGFGNSQFTC